MKLVDDLGEECGEGVVAYAEGAQVRQLCGNVHGSADVHHMEVAMAVAVQPNPANVAFKSCKWSTWRFSVRGCCSMTDLRMALGLRRSGRIAAT